MNDLLKEAKQAMIELSHLTESIYEEDYKTMNDVLSYYKELLNKEKGVKPKEISRNEKCEIKTTKGMYTVDNYILTKTYFKTVKLKTNYCGVCGKVIDDLRHEYCGYCGTKIDWSDT